MILSMRSLAGLGAAALMAVSMTTGAAFADNTVPPGANDQGQPSTCTTVVHSNPSPNVPCPPADQADPAGLSHTMTGTFPGCAVVGSRDEQPMDVQVASLDDSIAVKALQEKMLVARACCYPTDFVIPAGGSVAPLLASLGADYLDPVKPGRNMLVATPC